MRKIFGYLYVQLQQAGAPEGVAGHICGLCTNNPLTGCPHDAHRRHIRRSPLIVCGSRSHALRPLFACCGDARLAEVTHALMLSHSASPPRHTAVLVHCGYISQPTQSTPPPPGLSELRVVVKPLPVQDCASRLSAYHPPSADDPIFLLDPLSALSDRGGSDGGGRAPCPQPTARKRATTSAPAPGAEPALAAASSAQRLSAAPAGILRRSQHRSALARPPASAVFSAIAAPACAQPPPPT